MSRPKRYETNADKQRAYRERKRANEKFSVRVAQEQQSIGVKLIEGVGSTPTAHALPFETKKVGGLRMIVMPKETVEERSTMPVVKPLIYKDDFGRVITEKQFNEIQDRKAEAERKGYEIDEYSQ